MIVKIREEAKENKKVRFGCVSYNETFSLQREREGKGVKRTYWERFA